MNYTYPVCDLSVTGPTVVTSEDFLGQGVELPIPGRQLVLSCRHISNPEVRIDHWEFNGKEQKTDSDKYITVDRENGSLIITRSDRDKHEGNYSCVMSNNEIATIEVKAKADVIIESEGMSPGGLSINVVDGDSFSLLCKIKNYNNDTTVGIHWELQKEGESKRIPITDQTFGHIHINTTNYEPSLSMVRGHVIDTSSPSSRLSIDSVSYSDRANYVCVVNNRVTTARVKVLVRVKDRLAALWPFLGIVGEVIVLVTVIVIYEKRRVKLDFDNESMVGVDPSSDTG